MALKQRWRRYQEYPIITNNLFAASLRLTDRAEMPIGIIQTWAIVILG
jgi:hypothetical protein